MQIGRRFFGFVSAATLVVGLSACQNLATHQGSADMPAAKIIQPIDGFETPGMVDAATFLGADNMQNPLYRIEPQAWNDGYANTYRIETPDYTYIVQGTEQARIRLREIEATEVLKQKSTVGTAGKAVVGRTLNLAATPARAVQGTVDRFSAAENVGEALMVVPSGAAEIVGNLATGLKELGVTGWRITTSAAGTKCVGLGACVSKAGEDIWSGVNSVVGKHAAAQEIHASVGTNPYSQNRVLQKQVNRLAYADAYTSTAVKIGYTWSGVDILDPLATGVGYYNNGEFVAVYEDAHKARNREKALLRGWGVNDDDIAKLYASDAFTHISRTQLVKAVSTFGTNDYKARMIGEAANSPTRFVADSRVVVYQYLAELVSAGQIKAFVADLPSAIALDVNDTLILPFAADYLRWTPDIAPTIANLSTLTGRGTDFANASVHVLGQASPMFIKRAEALGIKVLEIH